MLEYYFLYLCIAQLVGQSAARTASIVGANLYDARSQLRLKEAGVSKKKNAGLTVVVVAHNDAGIIQDYLKDLVQAGQGNLEIIIIDNASTDASAKNVRTFIKKHPKQRVRLIAKRTYLAPEQLHKAVGRYIHEDIVLLLSPCYSIDTRTIAALQNYFRNDTHADTVELNVQALPYPSFIALLHRFTLLAEAHQTKATVALRQHTPSMHSYATAYTRSAFLGNSGSYPAKKTWLSSATVYVRPVTHIASLYNSHDVAGRNATIFSKVQYGLQLLEPVSVTYFFYLAYTGKTSALLFLAWAAFIAWGAMVVLTSERMLARQKIGFVALLPLLFLLWNLMQIGTLCRLLLALATKRRPFVRKPKAAASYQAAA